MAQKSAIIVEYSSRMRARRGPAAATSIARNLLEISIVFILTMAAIWTPAGRLNSFFSISAAGCVVAFAIAAQWDARQMGLSRPLAGAGKILLIGCVLCALIWIGGLGFESVGPPYPVPWDRSWQYAIWAVVQEFILLSIFFVRLEPLIGCRRTVFAVSALYTIAHIPNPVLTPLSFAGGLLFCEMFRRWRNIFPIGIIHAALGLTIAASFPDKWLHHMRVGIGYLTLR